MEPAPLASAPASLLPGARLGRYQILSRLRKGGMAELYLARQLVLAPHLGERGYEKIVAVKRVLPHLAEDATFVQMFLNEARIAAGLTHGNVAQVIDFGSEGEEHYLVLEYVHGTSVLDLLRTASKHGGVPIACALTIVHEVAAALHYAHEKVGSDGKPLGLVHRDVSPSNVLVSYDGEVKLVDFGIAKATAHTRVTKSGTIKGKLAYMAPEQVRGEALDRRADVFSLCVVAYELCTGRRCFVAPGEFALINRVAAGRYEKPSAIVADFPPELEAIIVQGLAVAADERIESARALQLAIEAFADAHGHRLSKVALSDMMLAMFGPVAYPTTDVLPRPVADVEPAPALAVTVPTRAQARRRATAAVAATTLVLGLGLGIGLPRWLGDDAAAADERTTPTAHDDDDPPAAEHKTAEAPKDDPDPNPSVVIVEEADTGEADDAPRPTGGAASKRKPSRKRPTKTAETPPTPATANDYLPPSRRPG